MDSPGGDEKPLPANRRIACVAVIGPNNGLQYLKIYSEVASALPNRLDEEVQQQMQEVIYNSLDVIEERMASIKSAVPKDGDAYIGCLAVVGQLSLFGQVTNTGQKLIFAIKTGTGIADRKEFAVRDLFRKLHKSIVTALLNPFVQIDEPIKSRRFDRQANIYTTMYFAPSSSG